MRRVRQFFSLLGFAGVIAAGAASASSALPAPPVETGVAIERTDWVQRCWWVDTPWGPRQRHRQVWVRLRYDDDDRGWDRGYRGEDWEHRGHRHWHDDD